MEICRDIKGLRVKISVCLTFYLLRITTVSVTTVITQSGILWEIGLVHQRKV